MFIHVLDDLNTCMCHAVMLESEVCIGVCSDN